MTDSRIVAVSLFAGFILAVSGCQSGGGMSKVDSGVKDAPPPPTTKVSESDLTSYCPSVTLREGTAFYGTYAKGVKKKKPASADDASPDDSAETDNSANLIYQASIDNVTRTCNYQNGMLKMDVAVAGKVVPGPMGKAGSITMPIRIVVLRGDEVLYSKLTPYPVKVTDISEATQFLYNDADVTFAAPAKRDIQVFAGYDEGPSSKDKKKKQR